MNILVPVDFSKASLTALALAHSIADSGKFEITFVHVINTNHLMNHGMDDQFIRKLKSHALKRLRDFTTDYPQIKGIPLANISTSYIVDSGEPGSVIMDVIETEDIDLVIMGIRDKLNFVSRISGTVATYAMNHSEVPMIMCHADSQTDIPRKIVFAFDEKSEVEDSISTFKNINQSIKASVDFLHVKNSSFDDIQHVQNEIMEELFEDEDPVFGIRIHSIVGSAPLETLQKYCQSRKADMIAMIHRNDSFIDRLFNNSKTIKAAYTFDLPLLILPE